MEVVLRILGGTPPTITAMEPTRRRKRPHPAHRARIVAGATAALAAAGLTGTMAVAAVASASSATSVTEAAAPASTSSSSAVTCRQRFDLVEFVHLVELVQRHDQQGGDVVRHRRHGVGARQHVEPWKLKPPSAPWAVTPM